MTRNAALLFLVAGLALAGCGKSEQKSESATPPASTETATSETPAAEAPATPAAETPSTPDAQQQSETYKVVPDPYASATFTDPTLQEGHDVFQKWCAPCHAPGPGHPGTQALAVKYKDGSTPSVLEERTDLTPDITKTFVRGGVSIMPPFRKTEITDKQLDALAAYLARPR
jgi:mono/diheme cytochrome c family protein